ncbi:MAG: hypothetical protein AAF492_29570 [Verrucomicrobiota bacterium]
MDIVTRIAQIIQEDGVVTDEEIKLLDQAIASDHEVTPEEILLINHIATRLSDAELKRKPDAGVSRTELQDIHNALMLNDEIEDEQKDVMIGVLEKIRDKMAD